MVKSKKKIKENSKKITKKEPLPIIDPSIMLSEKEKKQLIRAEKRKNGIINFIVKTIGIIFGLFIFLWFGVVTYDYIQTKNHQSPLFCFYQEERNCQSVNNDGKINTCHGLGYKSIIPSKKCTNIKVNKTFFGFIWEDDPFKNIP